MDVVVDASALVGELLRRRGRRILAHPEVTLYMALPQWEEAHRRIGDPDDRPTVALALALGVGVWTHDQDFFGSGLATWRTETLLRVLGIEAAG